MEEKVRDSIVEELNKIEVELLSVRFGEEDGMKTLFITIDSKNGVDTNLCAKAMRLINPIIDGLDLGIEDYILDVGSKGEQE